MVGERPKSKSISSTIIPPKSPPTYQAPLRASAGVASTVDDSATTMASFRIIFPFLQRPKPGSTQNSYGKRGFHASTLPPHLLLKSRSSSDDERQMTSQHRNDP